jgi:hypothetical protein
MNRSPTALWDHSLISGFYVDPGSAQASANPNLGQIPEDLPFPCCQGTAPRRYFAKPSGQGRYT